MDKQTLNNIINICRNKILEKAIENKKSNSDDAQDIRNSTDKYTKTICVIQEILDGLEENDTYETK